MGQTRPARLLEKTRIIWSVFLLGIPAMIAYFATKAEPAFGTANPDDTNPIWGVVLWFLLLYAVVAVHISRPLADDKRLDKVLTRSFAVLPALPLITLFFWSAATLIQKNEILPGDFDRLAVRHLILQPMAFGLFGAGFMVLRGRGTRFEWIAWAVGAVFASLFMAIYPYLKVDSFVVNEMGYTLKLFLPFLLMLPFRVYHPIPRAGIDEAPQDLPPVLPPSETASPPRRLPR